MTNPERVLRDLGYLHPVLRERAQRAFLQLQDAVPGVCAFETWRHPDRQAYLYAKGRTSPGPKRTNAKAWQSWHQYGLAFDVAVYSRQVWSWEFPNDEVKAVMLACGLELGPPWEAAHYQLTCGLSLAEANQIQCEGGQLGVWSRIDELLSSQPVK